MISWLLPREQTLDKMRVEVFADRDQLFLGESVDLHARLGNENGAKVDAVEARITLPDNREIPYRMAPQLVTLPFGKSFPGFALPFTAEQPGLYKVVASAKVKDQTVTSEPFSFFVKPYSPETVPRPARVEILQALSKASGGRFFENLDELNTGLSALQAPRHRGKERGIPFPLAGMADRGGADAHADHFLGDAKIPQYAVIK